MWNVEHGTREETETEKKSGRWQADGDRKRNRSCWLAVLAALNLLLLLVMGPHTDDLHGPDFVQDLVNEPML
jgi:hypothetical protein